MIKGVHTMFYCSEPDELRTFIKDKLQFKANDIGHGWLIFDLPEADMGVHPADESGTEGAPSGTHDISFYCDDIHKTIEELKLRGVEFEGEVDEQSFGFMIQFKMPGNILAILFEPKYQKG